MKLRKKEEEVVEVDDDDVSSTTHNDGDQTAHFISSNDISSFMHLIAKRSTPGRFFFIFIYKIWGCSEPNVQVIKIDKMIVKLKNSFKIIDFYW